MCDCAGAAPNPNGSLLLFAGGGWAAGPLRENGSPKGLCCCGCEDVGGCEGRAVEERAGLSEGLEVAAGFAEAVPAFKGERAAKTNNNNVNLIFDYRTEKGILSNLSTGGCWGWTGC